MHLGTKKALNTIGILCCALTLILSACGGGSAQTSNQKAPENKQILRQADPVADLGTFDPAITPDQPSSVAINMVFTGLVALDNDLKVVPELAESYSSTSDGLTYTFKLRPGLKFSDGTSLTSQDVVYSIDRALQPALKSTAAPTYLGLIKGATELAGGKSKTIIGTGVKAPDPSTVVITLKQKASYFLQSLTYSTSFVVEKKLVDQYGTNFIEHLDQGGGSGPWKVVKWTHKKLVDMVPNPNYYKAKPQLSHFQLYFYENPATAYQAYQVGQLDTTGVPSSEIAGARQKAGEFHQDPELTLFYYGLNQLAKPFDSLNMRKAFALAVDKDAITHSVWKDTRIPTNNIVPKGMPGYNPDLKGPDGTTGTKGNPTMAKQFFAQGLKDEGWTSASQVPAITLPYESGSTDVTNEITILANQWKTVLGVNVKTQATDFHKLIDLKFGSANNAGGLQMAQDGWGADYPDPQDFLTLQFDKGASNNYYNFGQNSTKEASAQQAVQKQLEAADAEQNPDARLKAYNQAEQEIVNNVAWIPVYQRNQVHVTKPYVKGFVYNAQTLVPAAYWSNIYIVNH